MQVQVLMLKQDDPKKCTAAKLVKFGLARHVVKTNPNTIILDPFATQVLLSQDAHAADYIAAVDCSWNYAHNTFEKKFAGIRRRLPPLFAGNPVNYSKLYKLTTVEALAAALYILHEKEKARKLLSKFKWGHTFLELNGDLLEDYSKMSSEDQIIPILAEYGIVANFDSNTNY